MAKQSSYRIDVAEFMRETSRLGPTVVGAYVNILLDYFEQGEAPPDDNSVLARIVGCDPDLWDSIRPKLAHLFEHRDDRWYHTHTEAEIAASNRRKVKSQKAAAAAGAVHSDKVSFTVETIPLKPREIPIPPQNPLASALCFFAAGVLDDGVTVVGADPEAHRNAITRERIAEQRTLAQVLDDAEDEIDDAPDEAPEPPIPQPVGIVFEGPLPENFKPSAVWIVDAQADGYSSEQIAEVLDSFRRYHEHAGTTSNNWPVNWDRWWKRKRPPLHPAEKKVKPRVEVTRRPPPPSS